MAIREKVVDGSPPPEVRAAMMQAIVPEWLMMNDRSLSFLAHKAGISPGYLQYVLQGKRRPSARVTGQLRAAMARWSDRPRLPELDRTTNSLRIAAPSLLAEDFAEIRDFFELVKRRRGEKRQQGDEGAGQAS